MTFLQAVTPPQQTDRTNGEQAVSGEPGTESARDVIVACAAVAALGGAFSGASPTGTGWWDAVLAAILGAIFVVAAARAHRYVVIGAATTGAMFVGLTPWLGVAVVGIVAAVLGVSRPRSQVELQAAAGGLTFLSLLHLSSFGFFGSSALLATAAMTAVVASGYHSSGAETQRRLRRAALLIVLSIGAFLVALGYIAVAVRSTANAGVESARSGLAAARAGDTEAVVRDLGRAQLQFTDAHDQISSVVLKPLLLVPVVAQHLRSVSTATEQGLAVTTEAATTAQDANLEELQLRQGQFDLDLLATMAPGLERAVVTVEQTIAAINEDRSPWLLPKVDDQLQMLVDEATDVLPEARLAAEAARVMPDMLGAMGERRYLMLIGSPGESREFGGFVGGYALIGIKGGDLDLIESGSVNDLLERSRAGQLNDPDSYPVEYVEVDPAFFPQNLTSTPNLSLIARAVRDIFPNLAGAPIDGVIYADPYALAAMTEFTGPVLVEGLDEPLDSQGFIDFMFDEQYRIYDGREQRFGAIGDLAAATASGFEGADLPGPEQLGRVLGPAARAGRLQIVTYDDRENDFLASVKLQRNFVAPVAVDAFAVIQTNATASKLDLFLHRSIRYDVTLDDDGGLAAIVDVELRSDIADDVPALTYGETDGTNEVLLSLYSPHELVDLQVNGQPHEFVVHQEFGFFRYALFRVPVKANESAQVRFSLRGTAPTGHYQVGVWAQPLVNDDVVEVVYRVPGTEPISEERVLTESWLFNPTGTSTEGPSG